MVVASSTRPADVQIRPAAVAPISKPTWFWIPIVTLATFLAIGIGLGFFGHLVLADNSVVAERPVASDKSGDRNDKVIFDHEKQATAGIEAVAIQPEPLVSQVWRTGRIAMHDDRISHISPPTEGVIREVPIRIGQNVAAGEILAILESRELGLAKLETHKAKMALVAEQELAARTRTTMTNADELLKLLAAETPLLEIEKSLTNKPIGDYRQLLLSSYSRRNQLRALLTSQQSSSGAVSESTLSKTESESEAAGATYTSLMEDLRFQVKNQIRQAELKLRDAQTTFDVAKAKLLLFGLTPDAIEKLDPIAEGTSASHLTVKAPFAGTVVEKHAVRSERVGPQSQLFVIADLSVVWVYADVFEADLPLVKDLKNRPIAFRSAVAGAKIRSANVVYTGDLIDKSSRSITLVAEATNADRQLKPGLFVEVGFDAGDSVPCLQVPMNAVLRHENKPFVFVQSGEDEFRRQEVALGRNAGERIEIISGLAAGDRVVVRGGFLLKSELFKDQMVGE